MNWIKQIVMTLVVLGMATSGGSVFAKGKQQRARLGVRELGCRRMAFSRGPVSHPAPNPQLKKSHSKQSHRLHAAEGGSHCCPLPPESRLAECVCSG